MQEDIQEIDIQEPTSYFDPEWYSDIEIEIIQCASWGMTNVEIAEELGKTEPSIKGYRHRIISYRDAPNFMRVVCDYVRWDEKRIREIALNSAVGL